MLLNKIYKIYKHEIYPRISFLRGSHRILTMLISLNSRNLQKIDEKPESIFDKGDWDNLLLLDDCRLDTFEQVFGESDYRISLGSATPEYIKETFTEGDFSEIVYVTGNPHFYPDIFKDLTGRDIEDVFHTVYNTYETDWDEENGVVLPEPLIRDAKNARKMFPDKKIIVHFMQPHVPFLTSELEQSGNHSVSNQASKGDKKQLESEIKRAEKGKIDNKEVREHYRENLEFIKNDIQKLSKELEGKTVITSDHGELLGEQGLWGHPGNSYIEILRKVPWQNGQ